MKSKETKRQKGQRDTETGRQRYKETKANSDISSLPSHPNFGEKCKHSGERYTNK